MPLAAIPAIAIAAGASAGAGIASSAIGSHAAGNAAKTQAQAAEDAAQLQHQDAQSALGFQQQQYAQNQANQYPWLQAGQGGLANLAYLLGIPGGSQQGGVAPSTTGGSTTAQTPGASANLPALNNPHQVGPNGQLGSYDARPAQTTGTTNGTNGALQLSNGSSLPQLGPSSALVNPNLGAFGSLSQGWNQTFQAPTAEQARQTPGYQFALDQGNQAIQRSAAANGNLLTGGTEKALSQYNQGLADTNYQQVYNNALGQYQLGYNQFENNQTNLYNRLASLAGLGQTTAAQLGQQGQAAANNVSNTLLTSGQQIGQDLNNAGAARASGYVGQANAISGGLNSIGNSASLLALLGQNGGSGGGIDWSQIDGGFGGN